jgi:hypothetical protein
MRGGLPGVDLKISLAAPLLTGGVNQSGTKTLQIIAGRLKIEFDTSFEAT